MGGERNSNYQANTAKFSVELNGIVVGVITSNIEEYYVNQDELWQRIGTEIMQRTGESCPWKKIRNHFKRHIIFHLNNYTNDEETINRLQYPYLRKLHKLRIQFSNTGKVPLNATSVADNKLFIKYVLDGRYDPAVREAFKRCSIPGGSKIVTINLNDPAYALNEAIRECLLKMEKPSDAKHRECVKQQKVVNRLVERCSQSINASVLQPSPVMLDGIPVEIENCSVSDSLSPSENLRIGNASEVSSCNGSNRSPPSHQVPPPSLTQTAIEAIFQESFSASLEFVSQRKATSSRAAKKRRTMSWSSPHIGTLLENVTDAASKEIESEELMLTITPKTNNNELPLIDKSPPTNIEPTNNTNEELAANSNEAFVPDYILTLTADEKDDDSAEDVEPEKGIPPNRTAFSSSHNTTYEEPAVDNQSETFPEASVVINNPAIIPIPINNTNEELAANSNEAFIPDYILTLTEDEMDDDSAEDVESEKGKPPNRTAFSSSQNTTSEESAIINQSETIPEEPVVINSPANIPI